jgi:hypothetical protein
MMYLVTDNPTSSETNSLLHFLHAKNMSATKIRHELCMEYRQNVMSEETVRHWCCMFSDGCTNVHNEE